MRYHVLRMQPAHARAVVPLIKKLAQFQKISGPVAPQTTRLERDLFKALITGFVALREDGAPLGYAILETRYSSNSTAARYQLHDLYVEDAYRGNTIATELLVAAAKASQTLSEEWLGYTDIDLEVLEWNEQAITFYEKLGAAHTYRKIRANGDVWLGLRLSVERLLTHAKQ